MQVGYLGLLKAINNFDPGFGRNLAAYAQPCISGETQALLPGQALAGPCRAAGPGTAAGAAPRRPAS